jgi:hypothetical protein
MVVVRPVILTPGHARFQPLLPKHSPQSFERGGHRHVRLRPAETGLGPQQVRQWCVAVGDEAGAGLAEPMQAEGPALRVAQIDPAES